MYCIAYAAPRLLARPSSSPPLLSRRFPIWHFAGKYITFRIYPYNYTRLKRSQLAWETEAFELLTTLDAETSGSRTAYRILTTGSF